MYEIGNRIYWLDKAGFRLWELKDSRGRVLFTGSRSECLELLAKLRLRASGMGAAREVLV